MAPTREDELPFTEIDEILEDSGPAHSLIPVRIDDWVDEREDLPDRQSDRRLVAKTVGATLGVVGLLGLSFWFVMSGPGRRPMSNDELNTEQTPPSHAASARALLLSAPAGADQKFPFQPMIEGITPEPSVAEANARAPTVTGGTLQTPTPTEATAPRSAATTESAAALPDTAARTPHASEGTPRTRAKSDAPATTVEAAPLKVVPPVTRKRARSSGQDKPHPSPPTANFPD